MENTEKSMQKIVELCKGRGFIFPGSDIYGGLANTWDYGPLGSRLKNNVKDTWRKRFIQERKNSYEVDADILMHPRVWEASGHVASFSDPLLDCRECKTRHRADNLIDSFDPTGFLITVSGDTLEILDGAAKIEGRFDETGKPVGIAVRCEIHTGVLEKAKDSTLSDKDLEAALSRTAGRWVRAALDRAQATGCDFLGLRAAVLRKPNAAAAWWDEWQSLFPSLPVTVTVAGHIDRSYDLAD